MTTSVPDILARIVAHKRVELRQTADLRDQLESQAAAMNSQRRDFAAALRRSGPAVISEIKKASPSKGLISADFDPARIAPAYERGGAAALSVLTDEKFFQGSLADLRMARAAVSIPVLRKDFTIDALHVIEAAANGADAILLIAAVLSAQQMRDFRELAERHGMAALVEIHDDGELSAALDSGAKIIGVNSRNLRTFEVSLDTAIELAGRIPASAIRVAESGIHSRADLQRLRSAGFDAFLIGERLMKSGNPEAALRELLS